MAALLWLVDGLLWILQALAWAVGKLFGRSARTGEGELHAETPPPASGDSPTAS